MQPRELVDQLQKIGGIVLTTLTIAPEGVPIAVAAC
jgi:hypothetical protein